MGKVGLKWTGSQLMVGVDSFGHPIVIGSRPEVGPEWAGMKPSDLLMLSAASCSAHDVVSILTKQKADLQDLEVDVTGEQEPEAPYRFTHLHLHYKLKGDLAASKVRRAINLSQDKYCSVINTLRPTVEITCSFEIEGVQYSILEVV